METAREGMIVTGPNGRIGVVTDNYDETSGLARIVVQRDNGDTMVLYPGDYTVAGDTVRMTPFDTGGYEAQSIDVGATTQPLDVGAMTQPLDTGTLQSSTTQAQGTAKPGMQVVGTAGRIGVVTDNYDETSGLARIVVQRDSGDTMVIYPGDYTLEGDTVRLTPFELGDDQTAGTATNVREVERSTTEVREIEAGQQVVIPVIQESIRIDRQAVERGGVRVTKRIQEREEAVEQATFREEVTVEHVPIGRPLENTQGIEAREEGDTLVIPVVEEILVVEKRLVLKEEIRITKRRIEETEQARVMVRSEQIEVENLPDTVAARTASA